MTPTLMAFRQSCRALQHRDGWQMVCAEAGMLDAGDNRAIAAFFRRQFTPYRLQNPDGSDTGMMTGYYVPELRGSRTPTQRFAYPLYGPPADMLVVDLSSLYPELGRYRLRGRIEGRRVVPYWDRSEIDAGKADVSGRELFWVEDPVDLFFLQIQGSGSIRLEDGSVVMVNYADQNGHPYRSIGKLLLERGEMTRDQMSMQNIKRWAKAHPDQVAQLLGENPSYVFFRELAPEFTTPPGALGVPLTPARSIAVDPKFVPLGAPVFLDTTWPNSKTPLRRLMVAQDTGGAIRGPVRADFFWGMGDTAGKLAGRMKQDGRMWVLLPNGLAAPQAKH